MKELLLLMFRIGIIGFGGGSALIPVIEKEVVKEKKLITSNEYNKYIVVASITPGALPVELAGGIGWKVAGIRGMILSAIAMAFPGAIFTYLFLLLISFADKSILQQISFMSFGVNIFIIIILTEYVWRIIRQAITSKRFLKQIFIMLLVFFFTSEKNLSILLGINYTPTFNISTLNIFAMAFFIAAFTQGVFNKKNWIIIISVCSLYLLCISKIGLIQNVYIKYMVESIMVFLGIWGFMHSITANIIKRKLPTKLWQGECTFFLIILVLSIIAASYISFAGIEFVFHGILSSLMSFGGGDAYLAVADAMFVQAGFLPGDIFYGQIIPIINVLPGSILCKTLTGIGYYIGHTFIGTYLAEITFSVIGLITGVIGSCSVFYFILVLYERLEALPFLQVMRRWIQPIIAGMLLMVAVSLIIHNIKIGQQSYFTSLEIWGIIAVIYLGGIFFLYKININRFISVVFLILVSSFIFNMK
ncbi:chromate transporter [Pectinatus brassicae]|uniref:Chromate transporter n=1 Tax=Pectinatus brassicae TaxID=862415 RepID=A0A840UIB0_9FIRM|nr:chromate transporter [Pectinatus brassicae]MBB5336846.1 chromate transporter [Pectinatus brassicae]